MANPLAGHTNTYHTYSFDEALGGIAEAGYRHVELSAVPGWTSFTCTSSPGSVPPSSIQPSCVSWPRAWQRPSAGRGTAARQRYASLAERTIGQGRFHRGM